MQTKGDIKLSKERLFEMFGSIKAAELKNVRTRKLDNKEMVAALSKYILRESNKEKPGGEE